MVWKKVSNSDAGDSTHFGGDDVDKISLTFNAETQTDPINIKDENLLIVDPADTAKKVRFDAGGITSSTTRVITIPDADITLASTVTATTSVAGLMSATDKTKLDAIEASATADQTGGQIKTLYEAETNAFTDTLFTKLGAIEESADVTDATNVDAAGAVMLSDTTTSGMGFVIDEDAMGSDSATKVPTQQSVVAYVESKIASSVTLKGDYNASTTTGTKDATTFLRGDDTWAVVTTYSAPTIGSTSIASGSTNATIAGLTLTAPVLGTVSAGSILTNATGLPATTGLTATGTKDATTFLRGDDTWAVVDASPLTTEGDVYIYTGSANARLPRGTSAQVLSVNAGGTAIEWADPAGGGSTITHAFVNSTTTTYVGTGTAGTGIDVGVAVATEASGVGEREIYIKKIDANNEGVFTVIHKNGAAVEVQIA
jgi:hypothetical protein